MYAGNFGFDGDNMKVEALTGVVAEDNVSWNKGKHEIQLGARYRKEYNNIKELQQSAGSHDFGGSWTGLYSVADDSQVSYTGDGFAEHAAGAAGLTFPTSTTAASSTFSRRRQAST